MGVVRSWIVFTLLAAVCAIAIESPGRKKGSVSIHHNKSPHRGEIGGKKNLVGNHSKSHVKSHHHLSHHHSSEHPPGGKAHIKLKNNVHHHHHHSNFVTFDADGDTDTTEDASKPNETEKNTASGVKDLKSQVGTLMVAMTSSLQKIMEVGKNVASLNETSREFFGKLSVCENELKSCKTEADNIAMTSNQFSSFVQESAHIDASMTSTLELLEQQKNMKVQLAKMSELVDKIEKEI